MKEHKYQDLVLIYKGIQSAMLIISWAVDGDGSAFKVFKDGKEVGANVTNSGVLPVVLKKLLVVPKKVLLQLMHENDSSNNKPLEHGVLLEVIDGLLRQSLDGDFIIKD